MASVKMTVSYYFDIDELHEDDNEDETRAKLQDIALYWQDYLQDARDEYTTDCILEDVTLE